MKVKGTPNSLSPGEIRRYYDDRFARRPLRAREGFYSWVADKFPPPNGAMVLDIACGGGYLLKQLQGRGCGLFGCDISPEALRIAAAQAPEARFAVSDAEMLPYPDASFDMVYNLGSLEHFLDMNAALREMRRILRPHSSFHISHYSFRPQAVVMVPNSRYIGDLWRKLTFRGGSDHHQLLERFGTLREWKSLLESGGFTVESVFAYNKFKFRLRLLPISFAYCFIFTCTPA